MMASGMYMLSPNHERCKGETARNSKGDGSQTQCQFLGWTFGAAGVRAASDGATGDGAGGDDAGSERTSKH